MHVSYASEGDLAIKWSKRHVCFLQCFYLLWNLKNINAEC